MKLDEIGVKLSIDKSSLVHDYLNFYESYLQDFRYREFTLIEFGVRSSCSYLMWLKYFPNAKIVWVVDSPDSIDVIDERLTVEVGWQSDQALITRLCRAYKPLVVIDDGQHRWPDQINTLRQLFPHMAENGVYILEDIHTSFSDKHKSIYSCGSELSAFDYINKLLINVVAGSLISETDDDFFIRYCKKTIDHISARRNTVIIKKALEFDNPIRPIIPVKHSAHNALHEFLGATYFRLDPILYDVPTYVLSFIEPEKSKEVKVPNAFVAEIPNATIYGRGIVVDSENNLIRESLINLSHTQSFSDFQKLNESQAFQVTDYPPRRILRDGQYVLLKQTWDSNYGHWLIESLPRVALIRAHYPIDSLRFIVQAEAENNPIRNVYIQSLAALGISDQQIEWVSYDTHKVEKLIYPTPITVQPWIKSPLCVQILNEIAENLCPTEDHYYSEKYAHIYVSRNNFSTSRRLVNEDEIIEIVQANGFTVIYPELFPFSEQVKIFRHARVIVGNLGAALTNVGFCKPGFRLLALATEHMKDDFFWDLVSHAKGSYWSLHGKSIPGTGEQVWLADFTLQPSRFIEVLAKFLSDS